MQPRVRAFWCRVLHVVLQYSSSQVLLYASPVFCGASIFEWLSTWIKSASRVHMLMVAIWVPACLCHHDAQIRTSLKASMQAVDEDTVRFFLIKKIFFWTVNYGCCDSSCSCCVLYAVVCATFAKLKRSWPTRSYVTCVAVRVTSHVTANKNGLCCLLISLCIPRSPLCLKKRPACTTCCYFYYIHSSIATIFGTNVAEKLGNQNVLYFPTTPN